VVGFTFRLSPAVDYGDGHGALFEGLLKIRLAHALGRSYIVPEQLFIELADHWRFFLPSFFGPNQIGFVDAHAIACHTSIDVIRPGRNHAVRLLISIHTDQQRFSYPEGARLYRCTVTGPTRLIEYASGRAKALPDGDFALQLHHYTSGSALVAIRKEQSLRSSTWNLAGTRRLVNVSYCYFTTLPRIRGIEDLERIAMATDGHLLFRTTSPDGKREEQLELQVYRDSANNRRNRLTLFVPSRAISPPHLLFHQPFLQPAYYEVVSPEIVRVGLKSGCSLAFDKNQMVAVIEPDVRVFDYLIEGDAARLDGLEAPYVEEDTQQIIHLERLAADDDPFAFWSRERNTDQIQGRGFEPRQLEPKDEPL
jgi:hypothetical protein